jgi:hypothetical protein
MQHYTGLCERYSLVATDVGSLEELGHVCGDPAQDSQRMLEIRKSG